MDDCSRNKAEPIADAQSLRRELAQRQEEVMERFALCHQVQQRLRTVIAQMQSSDDISRLLRQLRQGLQQLGMPFQDCGINLIDPEGDPPVVSIHSLGHDEKWRDPQKAWAVDPVLRFWEGRVPVYRQDLAVEDVYDERDGYPVHHGHVVRSVLDIPFAYGTLAVNSDEPHAFSPQDIGDLAQLAVVVEEGFRRQRDLRKLEERSRQLEEQRCQLEEQSRQLEERSRQLEAEAAARLRQQVEYSRVIKHARERLQLAFEAADLGAWDWDLASDTVVFIDRKAAVMGGLPGTASPRQDSWKERVHPEDLPATLNGLHRHVHGQSPIFEAEYRLCQDEGRWTWVQSRGRITEWDHQGRPARVCGVHQDVSINKQMEAELLRTQRLRAAGELAGGVSHNLNNILSGIMLPAQMLQLISPDPAIQEQAELILDSGQRAAELAHRLQLSIRGVPEDALEAVDVNPVIEQAIGMTRPRWQDEPQARGVLIELETRLDEVAPILGTKSRLHDLIVNLLLNAIAACPEGGTISIGTRQDTESVRLTVTDTGVGMDAETQARIFEPFFTTKTEQGTGLGLSTVHKTVTQWGGSIDVASSPGKGSTFTVWLPLWQDTAAAPVAAPNSLEPAGRPGRLVVVDDDPRIRALLFRLLSPQHEVTTCANGAEVLAEHAAGLWDVMIVDLGMAPLPGDRLAREIRRQDPMVTLILMTGWELAATDPRRPPFDFVVFKPFGDIDELEQTIRRALKLHDERLNADPGR